MDRAIHLLGPKGATGSPTRSVNALSLAWRASLASSNLTKKYLAPACISKANIPADFDANVGNKLVHLGAMILPRFSALKLW